MLPGWQHGYSVTGCSRITRVNSSQLRPVFQSLSAGEREERGSSKQKSGWQATARYSTGCKRPSKESGLLRRQILTQRKHMTRFAKAAYRDKGFESSAYKHLSAVNGHVWHGDRGDGPEPNCLCCDWDGALYCRTDHMIRGGPTRAENREAGRKLNNGASSLSTGA